MADVKILPWMPQRKFLLQQGRDELTLSIAFALETGGVPKGGIHHSRIHVGI
jgi:hypothetical protein